MGEGMEEKNISPDREAVETVENRLEAYNEAVDNVHESVMEADKDVQGGNGPEYNDPFSDVDSFFVNTNPFWIGGEHPEKEYLKNMEKLGRSEVPVASIGVDLETYAFDSELTLYTSLNQEGELEAYWELDTGEDELPDETEEEIFQLERMANHVGNVEKPFPTDWQAAKSYLSAG